MTRLQARVLQVCITIADGASYLAGCAKDFKTSAEASRITAEWMPRATASMRSRRPQRDWPLPNLVQRTHHTLYATGRTGRKFPETSPVQARMQSTDGTGRGGRVRGVADQLPRFLQNFAEGAENQAADRTDRREPQLDRSVRRASDDWNVFLYRVLCDSMYHPDGT